MKNRTEHFASVVLLAISISSCITKTDMEVRVYNQYSETISNMVIGPDNFGTVTTGQTTGYMHIPDGSGSVSGATVSGQKLRGTYTFSGRGKHHWTATINSSGTLSVQEDK